MKKRYIVLIFTFMLMLFTPSLVSARERGETNAGFAIMGNFFEETLRPILIIAIGILFAIVGTHTGVTIVKSSDEPEVRREAIKKFIGLFIGAFVIAVILIFYKDIIEIVRKYI